MPVPVSPVLPRRTSSDTTLGRILAATAATEPLGRWTAPPATEEVDPSGTWVRCDVARSGWWTTGPLIAPPSAAATAVASTSTVEPGTGNAGTGDAAVDASLSSLTPPLWTEQLHRTVA